jgi:hypothetical protein
MSSARELARGPARRWRRQRRSSGPAASWQVADVRSVGVHPAPASPVSEEVGRWRKQTGPGVGRSARSRPVSTQAVDPRASDASGPKYSRTNIPVPSLAAREPEPSPKTGRAARRPRSPIPARTGEAVQSVGSSSEGAAKDHERPVVSCAEPQAWSSVASVPRDVGRDPGRRLSRPDRPPPELLARGRALQAPSVYGEEVPGPQGDSFRW